jgi:hypothetical protein
MIGDSFQRYFPLALALIVVCRQRNHPLSRAEPAQGTYCTSYIGACCIDFSDERQFRITLFSGDCYYSRPTKSLCQRGSSPLCNHPRVEPIPV